MEITNITNNLITAVGEVKNSDNNNPSNFYSLTGLKLKKVSQAKKPVEEMNNSINKLMNSELSDNNCLLLPFGDKYEGEVLNNMPHGKGKYFLGDRFTLCDILVGAQLPAFCDRFGEQVVPQVSPALTELITRLTEGELKEFHEKYFYKTQK